LGARTVKGYSAIKKRYMPGVFQCGRLNNKAIRRPAEIICGNPYAFAIGLPFVKKVRIVANQTSHGRQLLAFRIDSTDRTGYFAGCSTVQGVRVGVKQKV